MTTNKREHAVFVFLGLGYPMQYISQFCYLPANLISSFFFTADQNCTAYTCSHFVIHPSTRRHLDYFHFISIVNTVTDEEL